MFFTTKAYVNSKGSGQVHNLSHDVKRAILESRMPSGMITVLSTQATVSLKLMENEKSIQEEYFKYVFDLFKDGDPAPVPRRSGTSADIFHFMAALDSLSLTAAFAQGRLLTSPFHDFVALDFEIKPGRREFVINVFGDAPPSQKPAAAAPKKA